MKTLSKQIKNDLKTKTPEQILNLLTDKRKIQEMNMESTNDNCKINDDVDKAIDAINRNKDDWHYNKTTGQIEKSNLVLDRIDLILQHIKINDGISDSVQDKLIDIDEKQNTITGAMASFIDSSTEVFQAIDCISTDAESLQEKHHTIMEILKSIRNYINSADNAITNAKIDDILGNQKSTSDMFSFIKDDNKEFIKESYVRFTNIFSCFSDVTDNQKTMLYIVTLMRDFSNDKLEDINDNSTQLLEKIEILIADRHEMFLEVKKLNDKFASLDKNQSIMMCKLNQMNDTQTDIMRHGTSVSDYLAANDKVNTKKLNDINEKIDSILERLGPGAMVHING